MKTVIAVFVAIVAAFPTRAQITPPSMMSSAYDEGRQQIVFFGGQRSPCQPLNPSAETWIWNGRDFAQVFPSNHPPATQFHSMAYDSRRRHMVLLTGLDLQRTTWIWDGTNWSARTPANSPTPRGRPVIAYDKAHDHVVLFGGLIDSSSFQYDTWVWDGTNWSNANPPNHPTGIGDRPRMAFDEARNELVLFGGRSPEGKNETWVWKGTNWEQRFPAHAPASRGSHGMAYDSFRREILLFGGEISPFSIAGNDTWIWNGIDWQQKTPVAIPEARASADMAFDAARGIIIMHGGEGAPSCTLFTNVLVWNGADWQDYGSNSYFPPVPKLTVEVSEIKLCWNTDFLSRYQVQWRGDLTTSVWTNLGAPIQGNGSTICITDQVIGPQKVYRVIVVP